MLQRVSYYVTNQEFCDVTGTDGDLWIPRDAISFVAGARGESCKEACWRKRSICEPSYFKSINTAQQLTLELDVNCDSVTSQQDIYYPAYRHDTGQCVLQSEPLLFSCVGANNVFSRLCPCRTFIKEQSAICQTCL